MYHQVCTSALQLSHLQADTLWYAKLLFVANVVKLFILLLLPPHKTRLMANLLLGHTEHLPNILLYC